MSSLSLSWRWAQFSELTAADLYECLALRAQVFVVEQNCVYLDVDGLDHRAWHLFGFERQSGTRLCAYLRLLPPGLVYPEVALGRIVIASEQRGSGCGNALVAEGLLGAKRLFPGHPLRINAQQYLQQFYQGFGFVTASEMELEDGIPHVQMTLNDPAPRAPQA